MVEKIAEHPPVQPTLELTEDQMIPQQRASEIVAEPVPQPEPVMVEEASAPELVVTQEAPEIVAEPAPQPMPAPVKKRKPKKPARAAKPIRPQTPKRAARDEAPEQAEVASASRAVAGNNARLKLLSPTYNKL